MPSFGDVELPYIGRSVQDRTASFTSFLKKQKNEIFLAPTSSWIANFLRIAIQSDNRKNASRIEAEYKRLLKKTGNRYTR